MCFETLCAEILCDHVSKIRHLAQESTLVVREHFSVMMCETEDISSQRVSIGNQKACMQHAASHKYCMLTSLTTLDVDMSGVALLKATKHHLQDA